jgi:predicted nucleic acid-binding protein
VSVFVDTSVFVYAVGRPHPLRDPARALLLEDAASGRLCTSSEVLQELLHIYLPADRDADLERAWALARGTVTEAWPVELEDVELARMGARTRPGLSARDLVHWASCKRRGVSRVHTFDRALKAAVEGR